MITRITNIRITALLGIILFLTPIAFGQPGGDRKAAKQDREEKIEQLKIAFITKELNLTTDEAEKFWPAYYAMDDALKAEKKLRNRKSAALKKNYESMTDAEVKKDSEAILDSEIKEVTLKKEHMEKVAAVIGYKKTVKLLSLERRFKRELLKKLQERKDELKQQPKNPRPGGGPMRNDPRPGGR
ncbi:MAG: hypothetical protein ACI837_003539 [Crocinitomicaceae bacterium]|jgi:hypothetical protein